MRDFRKASVKFFKNNRRFAACGIDEKSIENGYF